MILYSPLNRTGGLPAGEQAFPLNGNGPAFRFLRVQQFGNGRHARPGESQIHEV